MATKQFHALGLMSGTSLDGLDIAWCRFEETRNKWSFKILKAETLAYSPGLTSKLSQAHLLNGGQLLAFHSEYGHWLGQACKRFIKKFNLKKLDCIASHGHTIFHQPENRFTFQLGDGNALYAETRVPVVCDFRSLDVQLGGQGAPLVPMGDKLLFADFDVCLNIGGIANLSTEKKGKRIAFDICFANMGLNFLALQLNLPFDAHGKIASTGQVDAGLLQQLHEFHLPFQAKRPALAREHFEKGLSLLLSQSNVSVEDRLCTFCECIALQITAAIPNKRKQNVLVTGGGALNSFLISRIVYHLQGKASIHIPDRQIIEFKEALVFALLGVLRFQNQINVLKSVTKASSDSSSGVMVGI